MAAPGALAAMLTELLAPQAPAIAAARRLVGVAEATCDALEASLFPGEGDIIDRAVPRRRGEFITGRACAREALRQLGFAPVPILRDAHGAPLWPPGATGSITHCDGYRAAAVAATTTLRGLGIDAEPNAALPPGVLEVIADADERAALTAAGPVGVAADRLLWCAKEAAYKALSTAAVLTGDGREPGPRAIRIAVSTQPPATPQAQYVGGGFLVRVSSAHGPPFAMTGRWGVHAGLLMTAVTIPAARRPARARARK